jgi:hypothetical protein
MLFAVLPKLVRAFRSNPVSDSSLSSVDSRFGSTEQAIATTAMPTSRFRSVNCDCPGSSRVGSEFDFKSDISKFGVQNDRSPDEILLAVLPKLCDIFFVELPKTSEMLLAMRS